MAKAEPPLPGLAAPGHHPPAEASSSAGASIAKTHDPAVGPERFALRTAEDRRITATALIPAGRREGDHQVTVTGIDVRVLWTRAGACPGSVGSQVGIDQDRPLLTQLRVPIAAAQGVKIPQDPEATAIGLHFGITREGFTAAALAVAVGQQGWLLQTKAFVMAGLLGLHHRVGLQGEPGAAAIGVEAGHLKAPRPKQPRIGAIARVAHEPLTDKAVHMSAMAIAAGIHH